MTTAARRTEPTAWLCASRGQQRLNDWVPHDRTDIRVLFERVRRALAEVDVEIATLQPAPERSRGVAA